MANRGYRNRGSSQYGGRSAVNPWEGGMVPGRGGGNSVSGLLPTPPQQGGFLSTETQLALASNLLTTLLRPQQQQQVPSLLSLNTMGQMGGGQGYSYGQNRFQDRRKGRMDGRRVEPYGKPGQNRRSGLGSRDRKQSQGYRSSNVGKGRGPSSKGKSDKKDDDKDKTDDEKSKGDKADESEDGKDTKEGEDANENEEKGDKKNKDEDRAGRYTGVPSNLFFCHVCNKHMWDGQSFENHLKGRTHQLMMDKLEESYRIKVELLRHELKVAEQQREIEMDRMKRQGKKFHMGTREYCTMCDLTFYGSLVAHRKFDRHQQLKAFLHPRCAPCGKEFPTRIEWDHHKLTPFHLKKFAESRKERQASSDDEFTLDDFIGDEAFSGFGKREIKVRTREDEEDDIQENKEKKEDDEKNESKEGIKEEGNEEQDLDEALPTTFSELRNRIPKYNPENAVGKSMLKAVQGFTCRVCHKFFNNDEDATVHCRTLTHYNNFVSLLRSKARAFEAHEKREAMKKKDAENESGKRAAEDDGKDGTFKRRKVSRGDSDEDEDKDDDKDELVETGDGVDVNHDDESDKEKSPEKKADGEDASDREVDAAEVDGESEGDGGDDESGKEVSPKGQKAAVRPRGSSGSGKAPVASPAAQNRGRGRRRK